ncbi:MAG TPA: hypothetical protein PLW02_13910 [Verrucomicrobiota bacterium]|nr:hypothetical protein [Verrucomicrobiota bacterium]
MINRIVLIVVCIFWLVMNLVLYRYEVGDKNKYHSSVPIETVWKKVLMSPDQSSLEIFQSGRRIGNCRWIAGAGEEQMRKFLQSEEGEPTKNVIEKPNFYTIDFDGSLAIKEVKGNIRFYFFAVLPDEKSWSNVNVRVSFEKMNIIVNASSSNETVSIRIETPDNLISRRFTFAELSNPANILQSVGGPIGLLFLPELTSITKTNASATSKINLDYKSYYHNMTVGTTTLWVYRVEVSLFKRFTAAINISKAGEVLKVELPNNIELINEAFVNL